MPTTLKSQFETKCHIFPHRNTNLSCENAALPDSSCSLASWGSEPLRLRHSLCILAFRVAISSSVASPLSPWEHKTHDVSHSVFLSHYCISSGRSLFFDLTYLQCCLPLVKPVKTYVKADKVFVLHGKAALLRGGGRQEEVSNPWGLRVQTEL